MLWFPTVEALRAELGSAPKWMAVATAIASAQQVQAEVTYSVGAAVTYRVTDQPDRPELTGHQRYLDVRVVLAGSLELEVARCIDLIAAAPYDDLTDRQPFTGVGERRTLQAGEVLIVEAGEALRDHWVDGRMVVIRVTVEPPAPESATSW
ncbi:MAG: hypothetical protein ACK5LN_13450 [Propioniciclava sp.]